MEKRNNTVFKTYLIYFIAMAFFALVRIASAMGVFNGLNPTASSVVFTSIIQIGIMFIIPFVLYMVMFKLKPKQVVVRASVKKIAPKVILLSIALGFSAFFINIIVSSIFNSVLSFMGFNFGGGGGGGTATVGISAVILDLVLIAVLPALAEEFLHRGLLLNSTRAIGYKKAILISSFLFGLIHFNITQFSFAFVVGMLLGLVTVVSKSIWPAVIMHFINNALSVYLAHARANNWFGQDFYTHLNNFLRSESAIITFITMMLFIVVLGLITTYLVFAIFKITTLDKVKSAATQIASILPDKEQGLQAQNIFKEILTKNTDFNINANKNSSILDFILPVNKNAFKPNRVDNTFLTASIILGGLATIFTFVWGIL